MINALLWIEKGKEELLLSTVGGVNLLYRNVLALKRAGYDRILLEGPWASEFQELWLSELTEKEERRLGKIETYLPGTPLTGPVLWMRGDQLVHPATLEHFRTTLEENRRAVLRGYLPEGFPPKKFQEFKSLVLGPASQPLPLWGFGKESWNLVNGEGTACCDGGRSREEHFQSLSLPVERVNAGTHYHLFGEEACAEEMERELFDSFRREASGFMAFHLNKRLSIPISKKLVHLSLTANHLTLLNFLIGIFAVYLGSRGGYFSFLAATFFYWLSRVFDGCDGEVAKSRIEDSRFGEWLDTLTDMIVNISFFLSLAVGLSRGPWAKEAIAAGVLTIVFGLLSIIAVALMAKKRGKGSFNFVGDALMEKIASGPSWMRPLGAVNYIMKNDGYSLLFLLFGFLGWVPVIPFLLMVATFFHLLFILSLVLKGREPEKKDLPIPL